MERSKAFLIAIDQYQHFSKLATPVNDVTRIGAILSDVYGYLVQFIINPTKQDLVNFVQEEIFHRISSNPTDQNVLVYFAGHGFAENSDLTPKGYIIPVDGKIGEPLTWLAMNEFIGALENLNTQHFFLILDCCFGGAARWGGQYRDTLTIGKLRLKSRQFDYLTAQAAWQVLTSTAPNQPALDFIGRDGTAESVSPFAKYFIQAIQGEADDPVDYVISASDIYHFIQHRLPIATEKFGTLQNAGLFPLAKHRNGEFLFLRPGFKQINLDPDDHFNPYQGLDSYEQENAPLFFGRDAAIEELYTLVQNQQLTVISGSSGAGKSSLLKAGLIPKLQGKILIITPGYQPLKHLENQSNFDYLCIDQFEQLITLGNPGATEAFFAWLKSLLDAGKKIVLTIRIDYERQLPDYLLNQLHWDEGRFPIPPFNSKELREIVVLPAFRAGCLIEPPGLVDVIVKELIHFPGALPLLSFTMQQLFERRFNDPYYNITQAAYAELGGIIGALQNHADELYLSMSPEEQLTMCNLMLRLISLTGGEIASKRILESNLFFDDPLENARMAKVKKALLQRRLIRADKDLEGQNYLEPAHDALVHTWKRMQEWISAFGSANILLLTRLNLALEKYKADSFLWNNDPDLWRSKALHNTQLPFILTAHEAEFLKRSQAKVRRNKSILWATITSVFLILSALSLFLNQQRLRAESNLKQFRIAERKRFQTEWAGTMANLSSYEKAQSPELMRAELYKAQKIQDTIYKLCILIGDEKNYAATRKNDLDSIQAALKRLKPGL